MIEAIQKARLIVCVGAGGVGKTSISAALGLVAANLGRKTLVLTIDPARRLADALGISDSMTAPTQLPINPLLCAMMFDVEKGWQRLLSRELGGKYFESKLAHNRFFEHLSKELPGSHEFIACDEVYDFLDNSTFDLIILDTPPSAQGIQFLTAPQNLIRFFENDLFRALLKSKSFLSTVSFGLLDRTATLIKRGLNYFVEGSFVDEMFDFIYLLRDLYPIMTRRAKEFQKALADEMTEFVVIARPSESSLQDATELTTELHSRHFRCETIVLNQVSPLFAQPQPVEHRDSQVIARELQRAQIESDTWDAARAKSLSKQHLVAVPRLVSHDQPLERIARIAEKLGNNINAQAIA